VVQLLEKSNGTELIFSQDQNVAFALPTGFRNDAGDISSIGIPEQEIRHV
jgi:hypothetical protein